MATAMGVAIPASLRQRSPRRRLNLLSPIVEHRAALAGEMKVASVVLPRRSKCADAASGSGPERRSPSWPAAPGSGGSGEGESAVQPPSTATGRSGPASSYGAAAPPACRPNAGAQCSAARDARRKTHAGTARTCPTRACALSEREEGSKTSTNGQPQRLAVCVRAKGRFWSPDLCSIARPPGPPPQSGRRNGVHADL
jgi:hypothetical protein